MSFTIFITEFIIGNSNENVMSSSTVFSMIVAFSSASMAAWRSACVGPDEALCHEQ